MIPDPALCYVAHGEMRETHFKTALALSDHIGDPIQRRDVIMGSLKAWLVLDYSAAEAWAINSTVPPEDVAGLLVERQKAFPIAFDDQMRAIDSLPSGNGRDRRRIVTLQLWIESDAGAASAWIDSNQNRLTGLERKVVVEMGKTLKSTAQRHD
jgi:hypothetical protein